METQRSQVICPKLHSWDSNERTLSPHRQALCLPACLPSPCSFQLLGSCTCGQSAWSPTAHLIPVLTPTPTSVPKHSTPSSSSLLFKLYALVKAKFKPSCAHKAIYYLHLVSLGVLIIISVPHCSLLHVMPLFFTCSWAFSSLPSPSPSLPLSLLPIPFWRDYAFFLRHFWFA